MRIKNLLFFITISLITTSCWWRTTDDPPTDPNSTKYEPIIITKTQLHDIQLQNPKTTTENKKIYIKDSYIFVNDRRDGFHIIDNTNPSQPSKIKYLKALGSTDVAVRNDVLYINQARDLVALKINTSTNQVQVLKRIENAFPELRSPNGDIAQVNANQVVIDWKIIP